jgi:DNA-binding CsgD family transcriptional regulator
MRRRAKRPEQASRESPIRLTNWLLEALNGSQIGLAIYDRGFHYVGVNPAAAAMNGVPLEEHLGHTAPDVIGRTSRIIEPRIDRVFRTGQPVYHHEFSAKLPRRTGVGYWIQDYFPLSDDENGVSRVGIFVVEVTKQRKIEAVVRHLRRSVASGVTVDDREKLRALIAAARLHKPPIGRTQASGAPFDSPSALEFPPDILSERELEVLCLLAQGKSHKEAASALAISAKTVETYRSRIKLKLGLDSLVEMVHYAIRHGIVKP